MNKKEKLIDYNRFRFALIFFLLEVLLVVNYGRGFDYYLLGLWSAWLLESISDYYSHQRYLEVVRLIEEKEKEMEEKE